jgi:UDP-N-acetylmuramoyl-tripeptide--D-alanyl-D-alanine ligase
MTWLGLADIAQMAGGVLHGEDRQINSVSTDSRAVQNDQLFIALAGENFDAHDFVASIENKAAAAFVHKKIDCELPQIVVENTLQGLGVLAAACRKRFVNPVIGLTGSNGKTTVKEMLAAILTCKGDVMATFGNLNNDIGMPLTLLRLRDHYDYAVVEMGANHFGEIDYLSRIAQPNVAILNNAGAAHLEGFGDIEGVSRAKAEIFNGLSPAGIAIINADDQYADYWLSCNQDRKILTFGLEHQADIKGDFSEDGLLIRVNNDIETIQLALLGRHNALNALAASAAAISVGIDLKTIKQGLESLQAVKGRLSPVTGLHGSLIIDDTYNANPDSARVAIDVLAESVEGKRIVVLADMAELGVNAVQSHQDIGAYAKAQGIDAFYGLGMYSQQACLQFGRNGFHFDAVESLLDALMCDIKQQQGKQLGDGNNMTILVKGSRSMTMERVVEGLIRENKDRDCHHDARSTQEEVTLC